MQISRTGNNVVAMAQDNNQVAKSAEGLPAAAPSNQQDAWDSPNSNKPGYMQVRGTFKKGEIVPCPAGSTDLPPAQQWCETSTARGDIKGENLFVTTKAYEPNLSVWGGTNNIVDGEDSLITTERGAWSPTTGATASLQWVIGGTGKWEGKTGIIHLDGRSQVSANDGEQGRYTYYGELWDGPPMSPETDVAPSPAGK